MANTVITNYGAQYVLSAGGLGPYIAIRYFLPVYDFRIDNNIHTNQSYSTAAITYDSTIAATSAIVGSPTGEKIWNEVGYNLSTNYIVSGVGDISGANYVSAYKQSSMGIGVNTFNGVPLRPSYYGSTFSPPTSAVNRWTITNLSGNNGVNVLTTGTRSKYWRVTDYYPVTDTSGNIRGSFKCHLDKAVGRFKFNKVAMYAVRVDTAGVESSDDPVFFAEAFVKETCVKSNLLTEGFDDFVVDVQVNLTPLNNIWVSGFFSTSGDYWSRTVGGLYTSTPIGVGSFNGSTDTMDAALHVRRLQNSSKHLIRLDTSGSGGNSNYQTLNIDDVGNLTLSGTGGFVVKNNISAGDIIPLENNVYSLGTSDKQWGSINGYDTTTYRLNVNHLNANGSFILVNNDIEMSSNSTIRSFDIIPLADDTYNLGNESNRWKGNFNNITVHSISAVYSDTITLGSEVYADHLIYSTDIIPQDNGQYDLGHAISYYKNGYINNISATNINGVSATYGYFDIVNTPTSLSHWSVGSNRTVQWKKEYHSFYGLYKIKVTIKLPYMGGAISGAGYDVSILSGGFYENGLFPSSDKNIQVLLQLAGGGVFYRPGRLMINNSTDTSVFASVQHFHSDTFDEDFTGLDTLMIDSIEFSYFL